MKRRYFHGTTIKSFKNMVSSNFATKTDYIWTCSDDEYLYLWDLKKVHELENNNDKSELEYSVIRTIEQAFENAKIAGAISNARENELVVIEFSIDESLIEDDESCENMSGASRINIDDIDVKNIKNVYIAENGYLPSMRLLYVVGLLDNQYFNDENFLQVELDMIKNLSEQNIYFDEMFETDYVKMDNWSN